MHPNPTSASIDSDIHFKKYMRRADPEKLIHMYICKHRFLCCFFFHYVSAKFYLWPSSGDFTVTSDRNAESCNRIPNNYSLP